MEAKDVEAVLNSPEALNEFAGLNKLTVEAARVILERILREPDVSDKAKEYIYAKERSEDFKAFNAGHEKGYQQGHEAGFVKGALLGILSCVAAAGANAVDLRRVTDENIHKSLK